MTPDPDPDPPTPPTPTIVPCALVLHISSPGGYEDDLGVSNGVVQYLPPDASDWITVTGGFQRALNTYEPIQVTGFGCPVGSAIMVTCDLFDENGSKGSAELESYFTGPRTATLITVVGSKDFSTGTSPYDIVTDVTSDVVYGWLGYCEYQSV